VCLDSLFHVFSAILVQIGKLLPPAVINEAHEEWRQTGKLDSDIKKGFAAYFLIYFLLLLSSHFITFKGAQLYALLEDYTACSTTFYLMPFILIL
jgi:hypothetical protein